jgi:hypothetical protein
VFAHRPAAEVPPGCGLDGKRQFLKPRHPALYVIKPLLVSAPKVKRAPQHECRAGHAKLAGSTIDLGKLAVAYAE